MDLLRFINFGGMGRVDFANDIVSTTVASDYEGLSTFVHDAHLRRDIAHREDLTPFVRDRAA